MKKLFLVAVLAASSLTIASAKSYEIVLSNPTKAGSVQLQPGQYRISLQGSSAIFTDEDSGKKFTVPVKVESNADRKFDQTRIETMKQGDNDVIQEVDLGGSHTKLEFGS